MSSMRHTSTCRYCREINSFYSSMGSDACYCSKCGKNPSGKMRSDCEERQRRKNLDDTTKQYCCKLASHYGQTKREVKLIKPHYKYNWKLGKAERVV